MKRAKSGRQARHAAELWRWQPKGKSVKIRESVSQLAIDLLEDKTALPILSLAAEQDNEIIGNVIFSSVNIEGAEGVSACILAPLAVTRFAQRSGIGTQLKTLLSKVFMPRPPGFGRVKPIVTRRENFFVSARRIHAEPGKWRCAFQELT